MFNWLFGRSRRHTAPSRNNERYAPGAAISSPGIAPGALPVFPAQDHLPPPIPGPETRPKMYQTHQPSTLDAMMSLTSAHASASTEMVPAPSAAAPCPPPLPPLTSHPAYQQKASQLLPNTQVSGALGIIGATTPRPVQSVESSVMPLVLTQAQAPAMLMPHPHAVAPQAVPLVNNPYATHPGLIQNPWIGAFPFPHGYLPAHMHSSIPFHLGLFPIIVSILY